MLVFSFRSVFFLQSYNLVKSFPSLKKNLNLNVQIIAQYFFLINIVAILEKIMYIRLYKFL